MVNGRFSSAYFIHVVTGDGRRIDGQDVENALQWSTLMNRSNLTVVGRFEGIVTFMPRSPNTTPDRSEGVKYLFDYPISAKQCSDEFRDIACGVCDLLMDDKWSIRFKWSSGNFEEEYSEDFLKVYGKDSNLSLDEVKSKYDESRNACMLRGLNEMGYENPEDY